MTNTPDIKDAQRLAPRPGTTLLRNAAIGVSVCLGVQIIVAAVALGDETKRHALYERIDSKPWTVTMGDLTSAQDRADLMNGISIAAAIVVVIAFACWTWIAYSRLATLRYERRYSTAFAVCGWFIPFANFVVPKRVLTDLVDVDEERNGVTAVTISLHRWTIVWWCTWLLAMLTAFVSNSMNQNVTTIDDALATSNWFMARCVLLMVAATLGILMVCFVTQRQRELPPA